MVDGSSLLVVGDIRCDLITHTLRNGLDGDNEGVFPRKVVGYGFKHRLTVGFRDSHWGSHNYPVRQQKRDTPIGLNVKPIFFDKGGQPSPMANDENIEGIDLSRLEKGFGFLTEFDHGCLVIGLIRIRIVRGKTIL